MTSFVLKPAEHVRNGSFSRRTAEALALGIPRIEEVGCGLWGIRTTVRSNIEGFGIDRKPFEVANNYLG